MTTQPDLAPALALDAVCDHFTLDHVEPVDARRFAARCESHGIHPRELRALIRRIDKVIPPMHFGMLNGDTNPNNGKPHHWYTVGKQYSRVLELHIAKAYLDTPYYKAHPFDFFTLETQLRTLADTFGADEFDVTENTKHAFTARFWWD